jgi:hypothetical protein
MPSVQGVHDPGAADLRACMRRQDGASVAVEGGDGDVVGTGADLDALTCPDTVGRDGRKQGFERDERIVADTS